MKFGVYHLIWAPPLNDAEFPALVERARRAGAEVLEIAASRDPFPIHAGRARRVLQDAGLEGTLVTTVSPEQDIGSEDPSARRRGEEHLARYLGTAEDLGSAILAGPLYGPVWNPALLSAQERASRWGRCVESLARLGERAQNHGVRIAIEPLSRFHTSFLNTTADGLRLVEEVGHPAVGLLLDTFQMNIEEKRLGDAIRRSGRRLFHLHASENDRGTPGSGHVDWEAVRDALRETGYDGRIVIEAFNPEVPQLAEFLKVWRPLETDQDTLAREGLRFLRALFA